jgi:hypothetical protein
VATALPQNIVLIRFGLLAEIVKLRLAATAAAASLIALCHQCTSGTRCKIAAMKRIFFCESG